MAAQSSSEPDSSVEETRYLTIDGRRWRRSDPAIPERLRAALVEELMAARRQLRGRPDAATSADARARVGAAKRALGERGAPWWEPPTLASVDERLAALLSALSRTECIGTTAELASASHADRLPEGEQLVAAAIERFERVPRT